MRDHWQILCGGLTAMLLVCECNQSRNTISILHDVNLSRLARTKKKLIVTSVSTEPSHEPQTTAASTTNGGIKQTRGAMAREQVPANESNPLIGGHDEREELCWCAPSPPNKEPIKMQITVRRAGEEPAWKYTIKPNTNQTQTKHTPNVHYSS